MAPKSTDNPNGWCPFADPIGIPGPGNGLVGNYATGNLGRAAVCIHISEGSYTSLIQEFTNHKTHKSAHFGIAENGTIGQFVSTLDTAYTAGLSWDRIRKVWVDPEGTVLKAPYTPTWSLLEPPTNPNFRLLNIELAGFHTMPRPKTQMDALTKVLQYLAKEYPTVTPYTVQRTLIGHFMVSPKNRANCPGPHVSLPAIAATANGVRPVMLFVARHTEAIQEAPRADAPVALNDTARVPEGAIVEIDEERSDGYLHLASGVGFVRKGVFSKV